MRKGGPMQSRTSTVPRRPAFTLIELLITVALLSLLIGILIVALGGAKRAGESAHATRQVNSIGAATQSFITDFGYAPPLLVPEPSLGNLYTLGGRGGYIVPQAAATQSDDLRDLLEDNRYASEFTLAVYLMGVGDLDGRKTPLAGPSGGNCGPSSSTSDVADSSACDDGLSGEGIRSPGRDQSWNGGADRSAHSAKTEGQVYGPYLDPGTADLEFVADVGMYRLLDYHGNAVRYYKGWQKAPRPGDPGFNANVPNQLPSLDFVPIELRSAEAVEWQAGNDSGSYAPDMSREGGVLNAEYAILAAGGKKLIAGSGEEVSPFGDRLVIQTQQNPVLVDFPAIGYVEELGGASTGQKREEYEALISALRTNARYLP